MADLRDLLTHLGLSDGKSLLQSGNLVFRSKARTNAQLEHVLEVGAEKRLGFKTAFFVRSAEEWKTIAALNPFRYEAEHDPSRLVVMVFKDAPFVGGVVALQEAIRGPEVVRAHERQAYII